MSSSQTVGFDLTSNEAVVIEARLQSDDGLKADNIARVCLGPAKQSSVLLVTAGNIFLKTVLAGLPLRQVAEMTPEQYEKAGEKAAGFDVTIFDDYAPANLGDGNFLFFAAARTCRSSRSRCRRRTPLPRTTPGAGSSWTSTRCTR